MARIIPKIINHLLLGCACYAETNQENVLPYIDENTWEVYESKESITGFTALHYPLCASKLKKLAYLGIDCIFNTPFCPVVATKVSVHWEEGITFITKFNKNQFFFQKWLELIDKRPSKVILVDSNRVPLPDKENEVVNHP